MKVALFTETLPAKYISGVSVYTAELARGLIDLGHEVMIVAPKQQYLLPPELKKIKIIYIPAILTHYPDLRLSIPYTPKVIVQVRKFHPDIIHTQAPSFMGLDGLITARVLKIPCVATFQTMFTDQKYLQLIFKVKSVATFLEKASWKYHRWFYNRHDGIFVATPMLKQILVSHGFHKNKISIIPLSTDLSKVKILTDNEKQKLRQKYKLNTKVGLYMGRVSLEKDLADLILIWKEVVKEKEDASLLIIGDGPFMPDLKSLITKHHLADFVKPIGLIEHQELMRSGILSLGDIFVSTSMTETFGLAMVEAMAHQLPLVLYKSQGISEFVKDGGIVCQPANKEEFKKAILNLLKNNDLRIKMGQQAAIIVSQFDTKIIVKKTVSLYNEIINRKNKEWNH